MGTAQTPAAGATARAKRQAEAPRQGNRLSALARYAILDTPREPEFDDLAALAAEVTGMAAGAITFVNGHREWVKASHGLDLGDVPIESSLGAHVVTSPGEPLCVEDATRDDRTRSAAWVAGDPGVRAYAALPITTPGKLAIGTVAVLDREQRALDDAALKRLDRVRRVIEEQLEKRREAGLPHDLIVVVDFEGRLVRVNEAARTVLGYDPSELNGRFGRDFIHPDDLERSHTALVEATEGALPPSFENRYRHKDGSYRWLLWTGHLVLEEQVMYGYARDITERKEQELALAESEARYRLLAENATDMITAHELDGTLRYVSRASDAMLGYEPDELLGRTIYELVHDDDAPDLRGMHAELLANGGRRRVACRLARKGGGWCWVEMLARTVEGDDGERLLHAATRDISDQRRTLEQLSQAEERFRRAFDDAPIGMAIFGTDERIQRVNKALCRLVGYRPEELLGTTGDQYTHPDDVLRTDIEVERLKAGDLTAMSLEKRYIHKDGHTVWAETTVSVMHDAHGRAVGFLAHLQDISARKRAEQDSRRARDAAERANQAKNEFLSRMSHELRTPLNAVLGFAQLLELDDLTSAQRESVARILAGGQHLLGLINDVLDISRIEAGQLPIRLAPVRLDEAVEQAVELLEPAADKRSIKVTAALGSCGGAKVEADRQRVEQILINLISNAIKYGPEGSTVRVECNCGDGRGRINVIDEGPGIAPADREKLFAPFERLGAGATGIEGTGLGLALSRNLVEAMNGEIGVTAADGGGSRFWIELPLWVERPLPAPRRFAEAGTGGNGHAPDGPVPACRTLLYVEDNPADVRLVERVIARRQHCEVLHASTGAEGLVIARMRRPDVVLLDLHLPDMHGLDVLGALRSDPATEEIPVIVISATTAPEDADRALAGGAAAYEAKPIEVQRLFRALDSALAPAPAGDGR